MEIEYTEKMQKKDIVTPLKHIMVDKNLHNQDIADKVGLSKQSVSNALNPNYRPDASMTLDTLYKLCQGLNCSLRIEITPIEK